MVLVANKVDLVHLRKVTTDQGQEMAAKHSVSVRPSLCIPPSLSVVFTLLYICPSDCDYFTHK